MPLSFLLLRRCPSMPGRFQAACVATVLAARPQDVSCCPAVELKTAQLPWTAAACGLSVSAASAAACSATRTQLRPCCPGRLVKEAAAKEKARLEAELKSQKNRDLAERKRRKQTAAAALKEPAQQEAQLAQQGAQLLAQQVQQKVSGAQQAKQDGPLAAAGVQAAHAFGVQHRHTHRHDETAAAAQSR